MGKLRVAAYCRISTNHEEQESSLETQISYYGKLIAGHEDWELVKIYAERASGTQLKKRPEFMQMIKACKQGKIDLILTIISAFLTSLYTRKIKSSDTANIE